MRDARRNYLVTGAFVIAMIVALVLWLALLTGRTGATDFYHLYFRSVMGLAQGTPVHFQGFPIGQVADIRPADVDGFRVDVAVRRGWRIPEGSIAHITSSGLLATQILNIEAGKSERFLEPGGRIGSREGGDLLAQVGTLAEELGDLSRQIGPMLDELSEELPALVQSARGLIGRLDATLARIQRVVGESDDEGVGAIVTDFGAVAENLAVISRDLSGTQQQLDLLLERANGIVARSGPRIEGSLADLNHALAAIARHAESIALNLEITSRNLNEFSGQVRRNPGVLLRGREEGEEP